MVVKITRKAHHKPSQYIYRQRFLVSKQPLRFVCYSISLCNRRDWIAFLQRGNKVSTSLFFLSLSQETNTELIIVQTVVGGFVISSASGSRCEYLPSIANRLSFVSQTDLVTPAFLFFSDWFRWWILASSRMGADFWTFALTFAARREIALAAFLRRLPISLAALREETEVAISLRVLRAFVIRCGTVKPM